MGFRVVGFRPWDSDHPSTEYYARPPYSVNFCFAPGEFPGALSRLGTPAKMRASTVEPPFTFSPTFTAISAFSGSQISMRDPKRTSPMRSPRATVSPCFFQDTTRRATQPAICLNTISPCSLARVNTFCSFSSEAFSAHAARNFPGLYSSFVIVPAAGDRFTCTFQIARKILTRLPGRPQRSSSVTTTTRPSAGDTTSPGSDGIVRSGSRKKLKTKNPSNNSTDPTQPPQRVLLAVTITLSSNGGKPK